MAKAKLKIYFNGQWVDVLERPTHVRKNGQWVKIKTGDHVRSNATGQWYELGSSGVNFTVDAGEDQYLDMNTATTNLHGTAVNITPGVTIASIQWSVLGGVVGVTFTHPNSLDTGVSGLPPADRTTFRLTIVDSEGQTYTSDIDISVATPAVMYYRLEDGEGGFVYNTWDPANLNLYGYLYLPQGYDPLRPQGYPARIYFGGIGSNRDQNPVIGIEGMIGTEVALPNYLWNENFALDSIWFFPQRETGFWNLTDALKAINFTTLNAHVDVNRIEVHGYSSGGRGVLEVVAGNPALFSSYSAASPVTVTVTVANLKDVPGVIVAGYADQSGAPTFAAGNAADKIDAINALSPKGIYPPLAIFKWSTGHTAATWGDGWYNLLKAGFNFDLWGKLHTLNRVETASNYVALAEERERFTDWAIALLVVNQLPSSAEKTQLLGRLDDLTNTLRANGERFWMINFGPSHTFNQYTVTSLPNTSNAEIFNIPETNGTASTIGAKNEALANIVQYTTGLDHNYLGIGHDMYNNGFTVDGTQVVPIRLKGLDPTKLYDLQIYYSNRNKDYYLDDQNVNRKRTGVSSRANDDIVQSWQDGYNTTLTLNHYNVVPDGSGEILITLTPQYAFYGVVMAMLVKEKPASQGPLAIERWNFCRTAPSPVVPGWTSVLGDPTVAIQQAVGINTGWVLNTGGTTSAYWQKIGGNWAGNTEGAAGTYHPLFPEVVARSSYFTQAASASPNLPNINIVGSPGLGLPEGLYQIKIFAGTTNTTPGPDITYYKVKMGSGEAIQNYIPIRSNFNNYITFQGYIKDGGVIPIELRRNVFGYAYIGAIILERLTNKYIQL